MSETGKKKAEIPESLRSFFDAPASTDVNARNSTILASAGTQQLGFTSTSERRVDLHQEHYLYAQRLPSENLGGGFGRAHYNGEIYLPKSEDQKLVEQVEAEAASGEIFVVKPEHYTIGGVVPPTTVKIKKPVVANEYLMPPKTRLQVQRFQIRQENVKRVRQRARNDKQRMVDIMQNQYRDGVIGFDKMSASNGVSAGRMYADRIDNHRTRKASKAKEVLKRTDVIAKRTTGKLKHGYDCMVDDLIAPTATRIAGARGAGSARPQHDTHKRLFSRKEWTWNKARADRLGSIDNRGKSFNIVTGAAHHHAL